MKLDEFTVAGVKEGTLLKLLDPDGYRMFVRTLGEGLCVDIIIRPEKDRRTLQQNRYLWQLYTAIEDETGQSKESIHAEMCTRFLQRHETYLDKRTGRTAEVSYTGGSSNLSKKEFSEFVENVRLHAAEWHGLSFEDPPEEVMRESQH